MPPPPLLAGKCHGSGGSLANVPLWIALAGVAVRGWRPSFGRPRRTASVCTACQRGVGGGGPELGPSGGGHPGRCTDSAARPQQEARPSHSPVHLVRSGSSDAHQPQPAPGRDPGSTPARPPARPAVAHGHAGRSRSASGQACPSPAAPARPSGHPARPSPRCAPRSPHLRPLAIFTPPSGPAWAPDSVLSN